MVLARRFVPCCERMFGLVTVCCVLYCQLLWKYKAKRTTGADDVVRTHVANSFCLGRDLIWRIKMLNWVKRDVLLASHPCCFVCIKMNVYVGWHAPFCTCCAGAVTWKCTKT